MKKDTAQKIVKYCLLGFTIALNIFIIVCGFIDGDGSAKQASPIISFVEDVINESHPGAINTANKAQIDFNLRKLFGHFCLNGFSGIFTTLTLVVFLQKTKFDHLYWIIIFSAVFGFGLGCLSEVAQLTQETRTASFNDVLIDYSGYIVALLLTLLIVFISRFTMVEKKTKK